MKLFRCLACGVVYEIYTDIDGPQVCNECQKQEEAKNANKKDITADMLDN